MQDKEPVSIEKTQGDLRLNEPLASYTTWRIGGPAARYYRPTDYHELSIFLRNLDQGEPLLWLGLGSNVLISDKGFAGTVIHTKKIASQIKQLDALTLQVDAGVPCAKIAKIAAKHDLVGAEFLAGIPGTMGGALAMNAGAFGGETWKQVVRVAVINRSGEIIERCPDEYKVDYRSAIGPHQDEWFLWAQLKFTPLHDADPHQMATVKQLLRRRNDTQPIGLPSCGSVFRNPPGKYAAELIEASKLKGIRVGGAEVSNKHANFIINTGGASAADTKELIMQVQKQVLYDHGVTLQPEVKFIGF